MLKTITGLFSRFSSVAGMATKSLKDFGYVFNSAGELRKIGANGEPTDEGFEFNISDNHSVNQKNYEELGEIIDQHVYDLLLHEGLKKVLVPLDASEDSSSFVFATQHPLREPKKLLVLIHGSGVVRAGQWARRLIINNSLTAGTQLPYIRKARELGYEVLVTNTNHHTAKLRSPEQHISYVFEHIVKPSNAESIAIVAHSYGGVLTVEMAEKYKDLFKSKVRAIGLTDSVHYGGGTELLKAIACNWVSSNQPLDTNLGGAGIPKVSAGHPTHEWTSSSAIDSVFRFLEEKYEDFKATTPAAKKAKTDL